MIDYIIIQEYISVIFYWFYLDFCFFIDGIKNVRILLSLNRDIFRNEILKNDV